MLGRLFLGRRSICLILAGAYGLMFAMANCPAFHEICHSEAGHAGHHCGVTELTDGKLISQPVIPLQISSVALISREIKWVATKESPMSESFLLPLDRGPPFSLPSAKL